MSIQINDRPETKTSPSEAANSQLAGRDRTHGGRFANTPDRPGAEHYDTLLWRIAPRLETAGGMGFLLGLTSSNRQAGVSTVAANLAIRAADHKLGPVLLADCNFRHPMLHTLLRVKNGTGLTDVLSGQSTFDDCVQATSIPGLYFLPHGKDIRRNRSSFSPHQVEALVAQLREQHALVICDLPEAKHLEKLLPFTSVLDSALLVVRSERAKKRSAQQAVRNLVADGVQLSGAVLTGFRSELPNWLDRIT